MCRDVYIIQSHLDNSFYKGFSIDPYTRLEYHNRGESKYTSGKMPWKLVCLLSFDTKSEAIIKEKKLKKYPTVSLIALINSSQNLLNQKC